MLSLQLAFYLFYDRYIIIVFFPDFVASWPGLSPSHGSSCFSVIILDTSAIFAVSIFVSMPFGMRDELCLSHAYFFLVG